MQTLQSLPCNHWKVVGRAGGARWFRSSCFLCFLLSLCDFKVSFFKCVLSVFKFRNVSLSLLVVTAHSSTNCTWQQSTVIIVGFLPAAVRTQSSSDVITMDHQAGVFVGNTFCSLPQMIFCRDSSSLVRLWAEESMNRIPAYISVVSAVHALCTALWINTSNLSSVWVWSFPLCSFSF